MVDTLLFGSITIVYLAMIFLLGYLGYKRTKGSADFMLAGRRINPVVLALSYGATFISTSAIVGFGGAAGQLGMGLIWLSVLVIMVGVIIAFVVYGRKTRAIGSKLKALTFPDLIGKLYDSPFMHKAASVIIICAMPLYSAAILIGGARFIETTLAIDYDVALLGFAIIVALYVVLGGLIAVMYTDAMQGGIMLVGMTILMVLTLSLLGGFTQANTDLTAMADMVPTALQDMGMTGWTTFPVLGSDIWLVMVTTLILGVGIGALAQPQLIVRFMTVKDERSLNRAMAIGGPFALVMTGVAFTVGALSNVYFNREYGQIAWDAAGRNTDSIIPLFINEAMPDWLVVILLLALLAAAMSTLSSLFHTMGTSAGYDLWRYIRGWREGMTSKEVMASKEGHEHMRRSFKASQVGMLAMIAVSVVVAYMLPGSIIARATVMFMGLCAAAFLPAFTHALYSEHPDETAAKVSLVSGVIVWFAWTAFVHVKESAPLGICKALFGVDSLLSSPWTNVDPLVISLPISAIVLVAMIVTRR